MITKGYCERCGQRLSLRRIRLGHSKYCSKTCRRMAEEETYALLHPSHAKVSCTTTGAIGELLVSVDLLHRGFAVFRALSPACPCDLIALSGNRMLRIEVTKAVMLASGKTSFPPHKKENYDIMALFDDEGAIFYIPEGCLDSFQALSSVETCQDKGEEA